MAATFHMPLSIQPKDMGETAISATGSRNPRAFLHPRAHGSRLTWAPSWVGRLCFLVLIYYRTKFQEGKK